MLKAQNKRIAQTQMVVTDKPLVKKPWLRIVLATHTATIKHNSRRRPHPPITYAPDPTSEITLSCTSNVAT
jgi:hypothetical protein